MLYYLEQARIYFDLFHNPSKSSFHGQSRGREVLLVACAACGVVASNKQRPEHHFTGKEATTCAGSTSW
jgi:hypothetical protein